MKKFLIMICTGLALSGCEDFLEPDQIDLVYNDVFWSTEADAQAGLVGTYALYRGLMLSADNWYERADATTGFLRRGWNGGSYSALYTQGVFSDPANVEKMWGSRTVEFMCSWVNFYKVIAQANMVIAKVSAMDEDRFQAGAKERILGEAHFLRALVYFNIARIWGNAPYLDEMIESSEQVIDGDLKPITIARTDDVVIMQHVLEDAYTADRLLAYGNPSQEGWGIFANKGSAQGLVGHANMWMHFLAKRDRLADSRRYVTAAIDALDSLRQYGGYAYVDYRTEGAAKTLFQGGSTEAVFELNISSADNESYRADAGGITAYTCKMTPLDGDAQKDRSTQIDWIPYSQKPLIYPEYDFETQTGDLRPHLFFGAWDSDYNEPVNNVAGSTTTDRTKVTWLTKYALFTRDTQNTWDEYVPYFAEAAIPVFRYTDVMLLLAEAYCKNGEYASARAIVDDIRSRAGLDAYDGPDNLLADEVLQQRISELFGEGHLYFDMVRNNYFPNAHLMGAAKFRQEGYYWPVSSSVLAGNIQIEQTPYWSGKTSW